MLCISTLVMLPAGDVERRHATGSLKLRLLSEGVPEQACRHWDYLGSTPYRRDDGKIVYAHGFAHQDGTEVLGVPASENWWPSGQPTSRRRASAPRGSLRLVS